MFADDTSQCCSCNIVHFIVQHPASLQMSLRLALTVTVLLLVVLIAHCGTVTWSGRRSRLSAAGVRVSRCHAEYAGRFKFKSKIVTVTVR